MLRLAKISRSLNTKIPPPVNREFFGPPSLQEAKHIDKSRTPPTVAISSRQPPPPAERVVNFEVMTLFEISDVRLKIGEFEVKTQHAKYGLIGFCLLAGVVLFYIRQKKNEQAYNYMAEQNYEGYLYQESLDKEIQKNIQASRRDVKKAVKYAEDCCAQGDKW